MRWHCTFGRRAGPRATGATRYAPRRMRKLLYSPFSIVAGIIGARLGRKLFERLWAKVDERSPPPSPIQGETDWRKAVGGAALEAAAYAGTKATVNYLSAKSFHHLTGLWPVKPEQNGAVPEDAAVAE